uniref:Uncharacterized protein n=1 Tax=Bradyrhizobium amphicarpaeae TaxID=1404768 RepID=A0A2U8Q1N3_9BRAD|nr:hypothetical protein CIT40_29990 [Bradyrhizobium amphicarpaeae]
MGRDNGPTNSVSSPRKRGSITTGRSLAMTRRSVLLPNAIDKFRGMGPCARAQLRTRQGRQQSFGA